jgi:hypothetical protein
MRRSPAVLIVVLSALVACLLAPSSAAARQDVVFGIEQFGNMENPQYTDEFQSIMKRDGARIMRYTVRWDWVARGCNPATRGNAADMNNPCYGWGYLDEIVKKADAKGLKVLFSIYGTPEWLFGGKDNYTGTSDAEYASFVSHYAAFAEAVATRYSGRAGLPRVEQITIWNEPNGSFFQPRMVAGELVGPARYARLYDAAARRIKAVDATLRTAPGPTAPHSASLPPYTFAQGVLPLLQQWGSPIDGWAHNAYTGSQSPLRNTIRKPYIGLGNVGDLTALMDRYPVSKGKPIWITEFGYQTAGGQQAITVEEQPPLVADALYFAWLQPRIETFIWYQLHDDAYTSPYDFMSGLYYEKDKTCDGTLCAKPGAAMYRHTIWNSGRNKFGRVTLWGQGRMQPSATRLFVQKPGKGWEAYANPKTAENGTVYITLALPVGTIATICDIACGPQVKISQTVSGGGGSKARVQRLRSVTLGKRASLRRGIVYQVNCRGCRVTAHLRAYGRLSGIRKATRRTVIVGRARVANLRGGKAKRVHLRFTRAAIRELNRKRTAVVTIRTTIRYANGRVQVSDRPVRLR